MNHKLDPRVNFLIVVMLSTLVIFFQMVWVLVPVTLITLLLSWRMGVAVFTVLKRLKHFITLLAGIIVVQSLFRNDGTVLLGVGGLTLLTDTGVKMAIGYLCRVIVIIYSGAIIGTSSLRQNLQGMSQLGVPFELALMTGVGIRFLPMLMEEVSNATLAMELRGVDINALSIRKRVILVSQLFIPIIYSTLIRAQKLSESIETRGFVIGQKRSNFHILKFTGKDYLISLIATATFIMVIITLNY